MLYYGGREGGTQEGLEKSREVNGAVFVGVKRPVHGKQKHARCDELTKVANMDWAIGEVRVKVANHGGT